MLSADQSQSTNKGNIMVTMKINKLPLCHISSMHFHSLPRNKLNTNQIKDDKSMINIIFVKL